MEVSLIAQALRAILLFSLAVSLLQQRASVNPYSASMTKSAIDVAKHSGNGTISEIIHTSDIFVEVSNATVNEDTAIIISSSWIPAHPSPDMIEKVIHSIKYIQGLSSGAPIFVSVDHLPDTSDSTDQAEKRKALDEYVMNLYQRYLLNARVHIMASMQHRHIGGNVFKALQLIHQYYPKVEYLYYLQHDFEFIRPIDHIGLATTMNRYDEVNYIRFRAKTAEPRFPCGNSSKTVRVGSNDDEMIFHTSKYSDNNHLVRFHWYKELIGTMGFLERPPEFPMTYRSSQDCDSFGLYTYGRRDHDRPVIRHLDGRHSSEGSS